MRILIDKACKHASTAITITNSISELRISCAVAESECSFNPSFIINIYALVTINIILSVETRSLSGANERACPRYGGGAEERLILLKDRFIYEVAENMDITGLLNKHKSLYSLQAAMARRI